MQSIKLFLFLFLAFLFTGCLSRTNQVKDGKFHAYSTTTIGEAFDASFGNVEWTEKTTSKGQNFVEFKGDVDIDFFELLAAAIVDDAGDDLANPYAASNSMDACLGNPFAQQYRQELAKVLLSASISSLGLIALDGNLENKIKSGAKADFMSALANKSNRLTVQFVFTDNDNADFELGYYGFEDEEWSNCNIQRLLNMKVFLDFVYSSHTYSFFDYKSIAKEIVDQAEAANQLPDSLLKEKISSYPKMKGILISNTVKNDPRVIKRREDAAKAAAEAAAEQKRLEEEEAIRKAEEEAEQLRKQQDENLNNAMKIAVNAMKSYKKKMDAYKNVEYDGYSNREYPYWDVIGFKPPETEYFDIRESGGGTWNFAMYADKDALGVDCHWIIDCHNMDGCECSVSEDCKDVTPNLKSICDVTYDDF